MRILILFLYLIIITSKVRGQSNNPVQQMTKPMLYEFVFDESDSVYNKYLFNTNIEFDTLTSIGFSDEFIFLKVVNKDYQVNINKSFSYHYRLDLLGDRIFGYYKPGKIIFKLKG